MKKGFGFKNMKVFKNKFAFELKDITLFTGVNNSGKSSVINAIQLIQESVTSRNLDGILKAEFKTKKNKNKHGSIKTFINNSSNLETNYFDFYQIENNIEYRFRIELNEGIESYGKISHVSAYHLIQKTDLFNLNIKTPYGENFSCELNINYKFFVESFNQKCRNTENLIKEIPNLVQLCKDLDAGIKNQEEANIIAETLSNKYSIHVEIYEGTSVFMKDMLEKKEWSYIISNNLLHNDSNSKFEENGIIFEKTESTNRSFNGNLEDFNKTYSEFFKYGIFDFNQIWNEVPENQVYFENKICSYYKTETQEAYLSFSNDILNIVSKLNWKIKEKYHQEDPLFFPNNLIEKFITCFSNDFGLIPSIITTNNNSEPEKPLGYLNNQFIAAFSNNPSIIQSYDNDFIEIYVTLANILLELVNKKVDLNILQKSALGLINQDIQQKINSLQIKRNYSFVSSNRFSPSRTHYYDDGSELTKLLNELEKSPKTVKTKCYNFINKWLKEFDIADELVLLPDDETGNFKIYLKLKNKKVLLADFGLGTNQLLPIIFSLSLHHFGWNNDLYEEYIISKTVVIEEPESNLHPSLQSKLAEMMIEATNKFNVKIIAETHSEYLIRKLQYLVAKKDSNIESENIVIYYFYKPSNELVKSKKVNQIEKIEIDRFGRLTKEFGGGFFDEADNSAVELFLLNQYNKN
jgi:predicted ATPase